ncbi:MAG: hypothetical protein KIT84_12350 [Labilithrix sp.]|nr:hypothetical protein [Labilithrix sp.]MCW5811804.1 hypothetical protein [Labilithrix sp.]
MSIRFLSLLALSFASSACVTTSVNDSPDASSNTPVTPDGSTPALDGGTEASTSPAGWTFKKHGCPGPNRTDALFEDTDGALWVGCGTNAVGYGLYFSKNGGDSWEKATGSPTLEQFRVNTIERGTDGALYIGGVNENDGTGNRVLKLEGAAAPFTVTPVLVAENVVGKSFTVGTFRNLPNGAAVAESLTGTDALFRPSATAGASAAGWTDVSNALSGGTPAEQLLDLVVHDGKLYGAGSRIAEPPYVFVPTPGATNPYELTRVNLPREGGGAWTGEMWGIAANADRVVVVGENQNAHTGRIYVNTGDRTSAEAYVETNLSSIVGAATDWTWARGVCQVGQRVVVVGEKQPLGSSTGLVVLSDDGGKTFTNITPAEVTDTVSKCQARPDGTIVVAGAGGFVGFYR